jgi:hypothetical protein
VAPADWPGLNLLGKALMRARGLLILRRSVRTAIDPEIGPCAATPRLDEVIRYPRSGRVVIDRPSPLHLRPSLATPLDPSPRSDPADLSLVPTLTPSLSSEQLVLLFLVATGGPKKKF